MDATGGLPGPIWEVGCAWGNTSIFLCRHLDDRGDPREYKCIDTFAGFTRSDIDYEVAARGKREYEVKYRTYFTDNDVRWFRSKLRMAGVDGRAEAVQCDAAELSGANLPRPSFCFIDVDLYRPVHSALSACYEALLPGGRLVVDDCRIGPAETKWDGALDAYRDFTAAIGATPAFARERFGILEKR